MMTKEEEIKTIPPSKIRLYASPDAEFQLEKDFGDEIERKESYHGREILELLQNVDDAYQSLIEEGKGKKGDKVTAYISLIDDVLTVANTGTAFNFESIKRLCVGHASQKGEKYIGNKGTGFRSVLNWAREVKIYSDGYNFKYSDKFAKECFEQIEKDKIKSQLDNNPNLCLPTLSVPEWIEESDDDRTKIEKDYSTVIKVIINPNTQNDNQGVLEQLESLDSNILLFLPNISDIEIEFNNQTKIFRKQTSIKDEYDEITIVSMLKDREEPLEKRVYALKRDETHYIYDKEAKKNKTVSMAVAIPLDNFNQNYTLYNYFPLRNMQSPFGVLLHATFISLDQHRDSLNIDTNGYNKQILGFLLELFVDFVEFFYKEDFSYTGFRKLIPINYHLGTDCFKNTCLENFGLSDFYLQLVNDANILSTVNNENISRNNNPFSSPDKFPEQLKGVGFEKILKPFIAEDSREYQNDFFLSLKIPNIDSKRLCSEIDLRKDKLSIKERIYIFCWWLEAYKEVEFCPSLLQDTKGNPITYGKRCFYQSKDKLSGPELKFTDFVYLDEEYADELVLYFDTYKKNEVENRKTTYKNSSRTTTKRVIPYFLKPFIDLREFTTKNVISTINQCVDNRYENSIEFVNWLWEEFDIIKKSEGEDEEQLYVVEKISYSFPTAYHSVASSKDIYLGKDYGNQLEDLFINSDYQKLASINEFAFKDECLEDIISFFKYYEVLEFPKIEKEKKPSYLKKEFEEYVWYKCDNIRDNSYLNIKISSIDNIESLLKKDTKTVIKWILADRRIKDFLMKSSDVDGSVAYLENYRKNESYLYPVPSYLNFVFANSNWLEIENHGKVSPNKCLLVSNDKLLAKLHPCITSDYINKLAEEIACKPNELEEVFISFGAKTRICDLDSNSFYEILLKIPEDRYENKKLAGKIINQCLERTEGFKSSNSKTKFFSEGLVLSKRKGEECFLSIKDVRFSSSAVVNIKNVPLLKTPPRTGNKDIIKKIFNIEPFSEKYIVDNSSIELHPDNNIVEKQINEFLPFVYALRQQSNAKITELNVYRNLHIWLVSSISIEIENNPDFSISSSYTIIYNKNEDNLPTDKNWYVYLPKNEQLDLFDFSKNALEAIFFIIQNQMNVSILGEIFRARTYEQRLRLVDDKIDSETIQNAKTILFESSTERIRKYLMNNNLLSEKNKEILEQLDFDNIQELDIPLLKDFLNSFDYNNQNFKEIYNLPNHVIKDYNKTLFRIFWTKNASYYYLPIYKEIENKTIDEKMKYGQKKSDQEKLISAEVASKITELNFDPINVLKIFSKLEDDKLLKSIDDIYNTNIKILKKISDNDDKVDLFVNRYECLLYFNNVEEYIEEKFKELLPLDNNPSSSNGDIISTGKIPNTTNTLIPSTHNVYGNSHSSFSTTPSNPLGYDPTKALENARTGGLAELCVMESMEGNLIKEINDYFDNESFTIKWLSSYAKKYRRIKQINDAAGYDFYLCDSKNKELYIEVKSTTGNECAFLMSINEHSMAKKCLANGNYWIIYVSKVKEKNPNINVIRTSDFINNKKFETSTDTFYIQYKG